MKPVFLYLLAFLLPISAQAYIVKAKVVDETESLATGAVATLCNKDTTALVPASVDNNGLFSIEYARKGSILSRCNYLAMKHTSLP